MKIALLTAGIYPFKTGGIQKHSFNLLKYFLNSGYDVDLYSNGVEDNFTEILGEHKGKLSVIRVEFPDLCVLPGRYVISSILFSRRIFHSMRPNEYSLIYSQGLTSVAFIHKVELSEKTITNLHGLEMFQISFGLKNQLANALLRVPAKWIIKNSRYQISLGGKLNKILRAYSSEDSFINTVPNVITKDWFNYVERERGTNEPLTFVFLGRYERRKGVEELNEALKSLDLLSNNIQFIFVGPIPDSKRVNKEGIEYLGLVRCEEEIKAVLRKSDVLISPSYSEGMPTVILEAMASRCLIVATDVGAVSSMVDSSNGWLIEKTDVAKSLLNVIEQVVRLSPSELSMMKNSSFNKCKKEFTVDVVYAKFLSQLKQERLLDI